MKLFVSYARDNKLICKEIVTLLSDVHEVWFDQRLFAGQEWWQEIQNRLDWCEGFVYLLSPESVESKYCQQEYEIALNAGKHIFPVLIHSKTEIPDSLGIFHYANLSEGMENSQQLLGAIQIVPKAVLSPKFTLAEPFEWVNIPAGEVTLEDERKNGGTKGGIYAVPTFQIAKYPVTVAQYTQFVKDNGYATETYWTPDGWIWKTQENITLPRYWEDSNFHKLDYPIVGVSWHESIAFCHWLSKKMGKKITLPTEQQWQRAAQGDDGREYPWGKKWDISRCNHNVYDNYQERWNTPITSVTAYPQGASPYGVFDMAGNAWEWVLSQWGKDDLSVNGNITRSLRGGSWYHSVTEDFRCAFRYEGVPDFRSPNVGFRLARS